MNDREDEILEELRKVSRLLAVLATHGMRQREQIAILARVGFTPRQIAEYIGTTPNTVSVYLSGIRKSSRQKRHEVS